MGAVWPGCAPCDEIAATCIQWLNWVLVIESSPTRATALPGTLLPQAESATAGTAMAPTARKRRRFRIDSQRG